MAARGRPAGSPNKRTGSKKTARLLIDTTGMTPIQVMIAVMTDGRSSTEMKLQAARDAAPYVHPRLSAVQFVPGRAAGERATRLLSNAERARALLLLAAEAQVPEDGADNDDGVAAVSNGLSNG